MTATAITAAILAVVVAAAATVLLSSPAAAPSAATAPAPSPAPSQEPAPSPTPTTETEPTTPAGASPAASPPKVATRSARLDDVTTSRQPTPVGLHAEAIGVRSAPIDDVGIEPDGAMEIPTDISRIGWYGYGPSPGQAEGTAVLTAHIDSRTQGKGVFYHLDAMSAGDVVEVEMSDGTTRTFAVDEVRQIPKVDLPTGDLFRRDGSSRLALITCGGEFDESSRHYRDNLVVLATPVG